MLLKLIGIIWIITGTFPEMYPERRIMVTDIQAGWEFSAEQYGKSCSVCGKQLSSIASWREHMRTHTGKKPCKCPVCGQLLAQRSTMVSHMRIHTGKKPYNCKICNKAFRQKSNLNRHMRMHTGEKPYKCDICEKAFTKNENLKRHHSVNHQLGSESLQMWWRRW